MKLERSSPCKVNLLLNILGKRADGFHELETVMHPVGVHDVLTFEESAQGVQLTCSEPSLPVDGTNLVVRAAERFLARASIARGVRMHLQKAIPMAAGLGGGSGNAATTLLGLNELFGGPLNETDLHEIAAGLGSDIPFFLQTQPALATGRGERIQPLGELPALKGAGLFLIHPGFGIATRWAYEQLARFPEALNGRPGRAEELIGLLRTADLRTAGRGFYNSLEAPALDKHLVLAVYQEYLRSCGALAALMSGSGSTTFGIFPSLEAAEAAVPGFRERFGDEGWVRTVRL